MNIFMQESIVAGLVLAPAVVLITELVSNRQVRADRRQVIASGKSTRHGIASPTLESGLTQLGSNQRGYIVTQNKSYLDGHRKAFSGR